MVERKLVNEVKINSLHRKKMKKDEQIYLIISLSLLSHT